MINNEPSVLFAAIADKKRNALTALNKFNFETGEYINNYQKICDDIAFNIKKRLHFATHRYLLVSSLFKDFNITASTDMKFDGKLKAIENKEKNADISFKGHEANIDKGVSIFYNDMKQFIEGANKLKSSNDSDIVKRILRESVKKQENEFKDYQEQIKKNYQSLDRRGQAVAKKLAEFIKSYTSSIKDNELNKRSSNGSTDGLVAYINKVQDLVNRMELYGKQVINLREIAIELNYQYNTCLKGAVAEFTKIIGEFVGDVNCYKFASTIRHFSSLDLEETRTENFELYKLVTKRSDLDAFLNGNEHTDENIKDKLKVVEVQSLAPLFGLFTNGFYHFSDSYKNSPDSLLFITHDYFVNIYKRSKQNQLEKFLCLPLESLKMEIDEPNHLLNCSYKAKGFLWNSAKGFKISMRHDLMVDLLNNHGSSLNIINEMGLPQISMSLSTIEQFNPEDKTNIKTEEENSDEKQTEISKEFENSVSVEAGMFNNQNDISEVSAEKIEQGKGIAKNTIIREATNITSRTNDRIDNEQDELHINSEIRQNITMNDNGYVNNGETEGNSNGLIDKTIQDNNMTTQAKMNKLPVKDHCEQENNIKKLAQANNTAIEYGQEGHEVTTNSPEIENEFHKIIEKYIDDTISEIYQHVNED